MPPRDADATELARLAHARLRIDTERAIAGIGDWLTAQRARQGSGGILLGLSGGLDSCVLAALAVRALGPDAVFAVYLSDRDSDPRIARHARDVAAGLGISLEIADITRAMQARRVYAPLFLKLLRLSSLVAPASTWFYRTICRENPFKSALRAGGGERLRPWYKRLIFDFSMRHVDESFQHRHIHRRALLEQMARERGLTLVGAANLSECRVGWFVKDGIDDLPLMPMAELYKTQVRDLAEALELPESVRAQRPSPDMARGVTDEFGIGHDYAVIDLVADALDRGDGPEQIAALGVARDEAEDIRDLMTLSEWKRQSPHEPAPVSGRFGSPLRIDDAGEAVAPVRRGG
ncbi:NAD(+) synthase [Rhodosalinus halophilus]|uniref:NH(3)-dependent NAD(+) synthetase n=1 Tax=Rhodosalinus halophilus TaxID=2259333 RepID=A0A365U8Z2_9RHOB|nr:NAD(+) synthase [Rhodosalinus halophilus]RBI84314.1 NAD(+) synthase [Rhodosalinus halophilus]